eukprot:gene14831-19925_t
MLALYSKSEKTSLFFLITICLPVDQQTLYDSRDSSTIFSTDDSLSKLKPISWSRELLLLFAEEFQIPSDFVDAYSPNIRTNYSPLANGRSSLREESTIPFLSKLKNIDLKALLIQILVFLVVKNKYDGKGRVLIRNLRILFRLQAEDLINSEVVVCEALVDYYNGISHEMKNRDARSKMIRYAKIGLVGVGAGALLAVSGGLAAPAIAGALVVMGTTSAASLVSVGTMAALFGTAGAGLAGYKMMKRTKELEDFEFESYDKKGQMAVIIMVSGWIDEEDDYKRVFGVLPNSLPFEERLTRYYTQNCAQRLPSVELDVEAWQDNQLLYLQELKRVYGQDPLNPDSLIPPYPSCGIEDNEIQEIIQTSIYEQLKAKDTINSASKNNTNDDIRKTEVSAAPSKGLGTLLGFNSLTMSTKANRNNSTQFSQNKQMETPAVSEKMNFNTTIAAEEEDEQSSNNDNNNDNNNEGKGRLRTIRHTYCCSNNKSSSDMASLVPVTEDKIPYWSWREMKICPCYEFYLLKWEVNLQVELGQSIAELQLKLSSSAVQNILAFTVFSTLATAVMWPTMLLTLIAMVDGLWTLAIKRADRAGRELAKALLKRAQGSRPVTLVGYSVGSRVIYSCLKYLTSYLKKRNTLETNERNVQMNTLNNNRSSLNERMTEIITVPLRNEQRTDWRDVPFNQTKHNNNNININDNENNNNKSRNNSTTGADNNPGYKYESQKMDADDENENDEGYYSSEDEAGSLFEVELLNSNNNSNNDNNGDDNNDDMARGNGKGVYDSPLSSLKEKSTQAFSRGFAYVSSAVNNNNNNDNKDENSDVSLLSSSECMSCSDVRALIQDVVLLGSPICAKSPHWKSIRGLVNGRLINGYSTNDLVLGVVY